MDRNLYYIGIAFFGMINGIFNPLMAFAYVFSKVLMAVPLFGSESLFFYFAALMLSTATIILGGIPAAIYERFVGAKDNSTEASLWIWLAGTAILTIPAIGNFLKIGPVTGVRAHDCECDFRARWPQNCLGSSEESACRSISRRGSSPWKTCVELRSRPCCVRAASARSRSSA